ncbi:hypothetical protein MSUIS_00500 [Mycoplasma suis KI3806]|uniref:Uncharacterized protein n=1 Tax=Mycoplasma suis (strain KI_3806) TaxID=708248 RepID=F0V2S1_MYCS3|nr:hypothetical protein [Mycoplasma suis]CBZ40143.1 hypothetical protein MSUIS_00500 [Mycoplasma suis KI3806]
MKGKIAVISALTVGAGGTAVATTKASGPIGRIFSYSSQSSESLIDRWSGSNNTSNFFTGRTDQKNNINLTSDNIRNSQSSKSPEFQLTPTSSDSSNFSITNSEETLNLLDKDSLSLESNNGTFGFVNTLFKEIGNTNGASGVAEDIQTKINQSLNNLQKHKENFKKASGKVDGWSKNFEIFKDIEKKGWEEILKQSQTKNIEHLTKEEKQSLKEFYKEFFNLVDEKQKLIEKLPQEIQTQFKKNLEKIEVKKEEVLKALDYIKWESDDLEERAKSIYDRTFNESNLLFHLMKKDEGEYLQQAAKDVQRGINFYKSKDALMAEKVCTVTIIFAIFSQKSCLGNYEEINSKKIFITKTLDYKVASKLLFDMKRVDEVLGFNLFQKATEAKK